MVKAGTSMLRQQYRYSQDKEALLSRLRKIEGQARGIQRMIEEERYCVDIIQQLTALSAAAEEVSLALMQSHIEGCVAEAIREQRGEPYIKELMGVLRKVMRR
jgi:DNA-binding FrmR family transcriptional regulator